jgi:1-phosphatidylinositol phosphodiesterase
MKSFPEILSELYDFLHSHPTETLIVSLKQEDNNPAKFNALLARDIGESKGGWEMWFRESRIPSLGEVRGRCVMFSRFGGTKDGWPLEKGFGIHPERWPDSDKTGFYWWCGDTFVRTQDWFVIFPFFPFYLWFIYVMQLKVCDSFVP